MLTRADEQQLLIERVCDHLIDRDDYADLDATQLESFLTYAEAYHKNFIDLDSDGDLSMDVDGMFEAWKVAVSHIAAQGIAA